MRSYVLSPCPLPPPGVIVYFKKKNVSIELCLRETIVLITCYSIFRVKRQEIELKRLFEISTCATLVLSTLVFFCKKNEEKDFSRAL